MYQLQKTQFAAKRNYTPVQVNTCACFEPSRARSAQVSPFAQTPSTSKRRTSQRAVQTPRTSQRAVQTPVSKPGLQPTHNVVVTGGSKGLGYALAREFAAQGDGIFLCGRNSSKLEAALAAIQRDFPNSKVSGTVCDVSKPEDVSQLARLAQEHLGTITLWINNAGEVTANRLLADIPAEDIVRVVGSNVTGSLLCCREAIRVMRGQPSTSQPSYHIFNLGFSSWGASFSKSAVTHKSTKTALTQLTKSLAQELTQAGVTSIGVHNLSPGMVLTDLLLEGASPVARRFFNTLAEEPETVAAALAPRIRAMQGTAGSIDYLSPPGAVVRVVTGVPQILFGGRFFDKDGNRVQEGGGQYKRNGVRLLHSFGADEY